MTSGLHVAAYVDVIAPGAACGSLAASSAEVPAPCGGDIKLSSSLCASAPAAASGDDIRPRPMTGREEGLHANCLHGANGAGTNDKQFVCAGFFSVSSSQYNKNAPNAPATNTNTTSNV